MRRNYQGSTAPLAPIDATNQQINHPSPPVTIVLDVHNTYIDAEQVAYEEVASVISSKDDPIMLCLTFRVWFIGLFFTAFRASVNQFFWYRTNHNFYLYPSLVILLSFLIGKLFALLLPTKCWSIGNHYRFSLNPGPFTFKEHILIFVMSDASLHGINLATPIDVQRILRNKSFHFTTGIVFGASLLLTVFGIAGIMRRFLVWPSSLIWPENLTNIILIRTLNDQFVDGFSASASSSTQELSRLKFFILATICQCIYYWLPHHFMPILLGFGWLCWLNPNSIIWSQMTGMKGFGVGSLVFDWAWMTDMWKSPIIVPLWAKINILIGFVLVVWMLGPLCFYTNFLELNYSPIRNNAILRSKGYVDDRNAYFERSTLSINETKYKLYVEQHGEIRLSVVIVFQYGFSLLLFTSLIVHTILYHGSDILKQARTSVSNRNNDIHCFLMSQYPETPEWWFTIVFILSLISGMLVCQFSELMEWYNVLLAVAVSWILILPCGIVRANTGFVFYHMLSWFTGSYVLHKKWMELVTFRLYCWFLQSNTLTLVSSLKLCHYAKIPPRNVFITLVVARLVAAIVSYAVSEALFLNIQGLCYQNVNWWCSITKEEIQHAVVLTTLGESSFLRNTKVVSIL